MSEKDEDLLRRHQEAEANPVTFSFSDLSLPDPAALADPERFRGVTGPFAGRLAFLRQCAIIALCVGGFDAPDCRHADRCPAVFLPCRCRNHLG